MTIVREAIGVAIGRTSFVGAALRRPQKALPFDIFTHFDRNRAALAAMHEAAQRAQTMNLTPDEIKEMIRVARKRVLEP